MSSQITMMCDSPSCFNKITWNPTDPDTVPDTVRHWDSIVRADKTELHFCSGECIIKWVQKRYVQLKGIKELAAEEQKAVDSKMDKVVREVQKGC